MTVQKRKVLERLRRLPSDIDRNSYLAEVCDNNETLFYALLVENMEYLAPIVYTPTVGQACQEFGYRFRRPRGMYLSALDKGHMHSCIGNWPQRDVQVIVVTDGSRILGLGDLGAYGMGIPIGKLALYCAAGGIAPHRVMPVCLDAGTNNEKLLKDPFYIGLVQKRLRGDAYFELVDEFLDAIRNRFPDAFVQFEDFSSDVIDFLSAAPLCVFNDDIQGTGAVTLAGLFSGLINRGLTPESLKDQRFVIAGAGSAGTGVATAILQGIMKQGLTYGEAVSKFVVVDKDGPLTVDRLGKLTKEQSVFARDDMALGMTLLDVVKQFKPTILMGLSAVGGLFTEEIVREVKVHCPQPFIFPLSNPTANAECSAEDAYRWTEGECIFASGSPFAPVTLPSGRILYPSQCNNMFIFPGIGLAASVLKLKQITDDMLYEASVAVAKSLTDDDRKAGRVYPHVNDIRHVSLNVAVAVGKKGIESGLSKAYDSTDIPHLEEILSSKMYNPTYVPLIKNADQQ
ncbi:hypothetical protein GUITHDRAFT_95097 [Guillardia theta CCMP2712]|uniref:Malic enzyme n=1 Tax=Guillardia theta (strain CCMP2712) TaxID=905079 RepID=L1J7M7_GUITC|nr:hypothetical protein GUITHDRAFT_95097 [Guillardia theta CCMP2712]EKX44307.1 hypothetical protein GUITHDRAFT_95097 [Guillardia theta CCMP2712]|eukprot:XP_005831287.1 hypothetical protein GUITHDRAFT_95097 [Guillardia theta CCMP2712]